MGLTKCIKEEEKNSRSCYMWYLLGTIISQITTSQFLWSTAVRFSHFVIFC